LKILIAEDDPISCFMLEATLSKWGYEVVVTRDGQQALEALQKEDAPQLAILDWMMPGLDGIDVCKRIREKESQKSLYIILLTAKREKQDIVTGLEMGADDYVAKPFDRSELHARIQVGVRILDLQQALAQRIAELETAMANIKQLEGILPICSYCRKIRDDRNYWQQVESYVAAHTNAQFSHSICPHCLDHIVKPQLEALGQPFKQSA
jgi:sigma-B regulation protein RsbU (phosphoserine phosphatase)